MSLLPAILFAVGFFVSMMAALMARLWLKKHPGEGFIFLAAISLRLIALLIGCTAVYLLATTQRTQGITAFALGVAAGWVAHVAFALLAVRK
ncbi:MAG: hypothetical protein J0L53_04795 [Spirochaetes bacterium]|nr:hypothetical protein [Spirochaetota bacterium]MBX3722925.1 hypothetical protein [Turneriella sp.]